MDEYDLRRLPAYQDRTLRIEREELLALIPDVPEEIVVAICSGEAE